MSFSQQTLDPSIFRAYDIRGIVNKTLTPETVFLIGKAIGSQALELNQNQVIIARDGRESGPKLSKELSNGILSSGCHVIDIGCVPTPLLYFAINLLSQHSGVMLTGSHNPKEYNGLKIVMNGVTLASDEIQALYQRIQEKRFCEGQGEYQRKNISADYVNRILHDIQLQRPLEIVIDGGNGVAGQIACEIFNRLGCTVHPLYCEIDGNFPNHHPDPSQPENLQDLIRAVTEKKADLGLAFDGDGDRLGVVTNQGEIIWPDRLLMLFSKDLLLHHPKANIIYDVKCTHLLAEFIRSHGGNPILWKTGHSNIKAKLAETNALLAGEMSGHFFLKDRWYGFDDAIYAAARLLEILSQESQTSTEIFASIPNSINTPELRVPVAENEKLSIMQKLYQNIYFDVAYEVITIDGLRIHFDQGWGLVRSSNTSPYLILRFEANSVIFLKKIQAMFRRWLLSVDSDLVLPF